MARTGKFKMYKRAAERAAKRAAEQAKGTELLNMASGISNVPVKQESLSFFSWLFGGNREADTQAIKLAKLPRKEAEVVYESPEP